jgi:hypothetical protein
MKYAIATLALLLLAACEASPRTHALYAENEISPRHRVDTFVSEQQCLDYVYRMTWQHPDLIWTCELIEPVQ